MPSTNQCIGSHYDELKQRVFYFNYNSSGYNGIYVYDMKTNAISPLLISYVDSAEDIFGFDPKYPIASVNILYRTEEEGDILHWTDRLNRPMKLNILEATVSGKTYGADWKKTYLTVARPMPLMSPVCSYVDDSNVTTNNLRNKLYEFRYRWIYKDNTKSTWGPWSKMFTPANADSLSDDSNQTKNNRIDVILNTGSKDCIAIEIAARHNIGSSFTDTMLVATLDKALLSISSNSSYTYKFYNDNVYEFIDKEEESLLFDYCPKTANAQELLNGNIIVYGGIKEGNTFDKILNVSKEVSLISNTTTAGLTIVKYDTNYYYNSSYRNAVLFQFTGGLSGVVNITLNAQYYFPLPTPPGGVVNFMRTGLYSVNSGDTFTEVLAYMKSYFNQSGTGFGAMISSDSNGSNFIPANSILIYPTQGSSTMAVTGSSSYTTGTSGITDVNNSVYKSGARYAFGLVYFDEFGVTNGVVTNDNMSLLTPEGESTNLGNAQLSIPNITFSINHTAPSWAKSFSFVRTNNLTVSGLKPIVCSNTIKGTGLNAGYVYFNINAYQKNTSGFEAYSFSKGDRVRILGIKGGASSYAYVKDCSIADLIIGSPTTPWNLGDGSVPTEIFLKVPYDSSFMSNYGTTGYTSFYLELYTPSAYKNTESKIYYEFGETYPIIIDSSGNSVHQGQSQSQSLNYNSSIPGPSTPPSAAIYSIDGVPQFGNLSAGTYNYKIQFVTADGNSSPSQAATVTISSGSYKVNLTNIPIGPAGTTARIIYRTQANGTAYKTLYTINENTSTTYIDNIADGGLGSLIQIPAVFSFTRGDFYQRTRIEPIDGSTLYIIDSSVSDKYESNIIGFGRAFIVDPFAKETYFPTTIRYSLEYQQNTNINNTNRFNDANIDDYDRQRGDIQRFVTRGNQLRVFQSRGCGMVPIYQNVMQTADGTDVVSQNASVLNRIQYYQGEFGLGNQYCSLASSASADYFTDPIIGAQVRLSADGITSLTEIYKAHYYFNDKITKYQKSVSDKFGNGGYAKILGVYDVFEEQFTTCMQGSADSGNPITDMTFSFSEPKNCYVSFYDYYPEWICNAGNLVITWKNGELWTHNNTSTYANFYGTQYNPSITFVFNEHQNIKKHYNTITTLGNTTWVAPTQGNINTNLGQQSKLVQADFKIKDDKYHAVFKRDALSSRGLLNGNVLKGSWLELNLMPVNPQNLVDLYYIDISILEPLNNR